MRYLKSLLCLLVIAVVPAGLAAAGDDLTKKEVSKVVREAMDTSANPCQDFYQYACGGWIEATELPSDQSRWTRSFSVIRESNREFIRDVLEDAGAKPGDDPDRKKLGDIYFYFINL